MSYRSRLFTKGDIYNIPDSDKLFIGAVNENLRFHMKHCPEFDKILQMHGFETDSLETVNDLYKIPVLPTMFLKEHSLFSVPENKRTISGTTSGTSGKPTEVSMDRNTTALAFFMVMRMFSYHKLFSPSPTNYVILGYEPSVRNKTGIAQAAYGMTLAAPALNRAYALKDTGRDYELDMDGVIRSLMEYEKKGSPVRLVGLPAYFLFLMEAMEKAGIRLELNPNSKVILHGGWKKFWRESADKRTLYNMSEKNIGITEKRFHDIYGPVEHPITYCDCKNHNFHVPIYSRIIIRDVKTMAPLGYGKPGLVNLITPLMGSMPYTSIMTDDLAVMHPGKECGCGIKAPWFELLGRAGANVRTCAADAGELLKG